jgi:hypothetical protein
MSYGAGAAGFSPRDRAALALIFGMHILGLFAWMQQRPARLPTMPQVVTFLLRPSAPPLPKPESPTFAAPPRPVFPSLPKLLPPLGAAVSGAAPAPTPAASPPTAPASAPAVVAPATPAVIGVEAAGPPASVQDAIREQRQADGGFGLNLSRRQAGRIDRELRKGKSGVPDEPDTPMGRFRRGLEAAHVERSMSVQEDSYTSPDGTVIYRKRIGNGSICRRGGNVSPLGMSRMKMGGEAADNIPCPSGVDWKKD